MDHLEKAIDRLDEVLQKTETTIVVDATIHRFKLTYELMWKSLKFFLEDIHGVRALSPKQVFKEAYRLSIINEEELFLEMLHSRNLLSHTYNEETAIKIYKRCPVYLSVIQDVFKKISRQ